VWELSWKRTGADFPVVLSCGVVRVDDWMGRAPACMRSQGLQGGRREALRHNVVLRVQGRQRHQLLEVMQART